jgi:hypothetical protein
MPLLVITTLLARHSDPRIEFRTMRHAILAAGLIELLEPLQREKHRAKAIGTHDLVFRGALRVEAGMEGETIDRIAALIESTRALSGALALVLASTPPGELSADEMDALTDLSYKIHLDLDQLQKLWVQVSDELTKARN